MTVAFLTFHPQRAPKLNVSIGRVLLLAASLFVGGCGSDEPSSDRDHDGGSGGSTPEWDGGAVSSPICDPLAMPEVEAGTVGRCVPVEVAPGHTVCLMNEPQSPKHDDPVHEQACRSTRSLQQPLTEARNLLEEVRQSCSGFAIHDQGRFGWCTAHATTAAAEIQLCLQTGSTEGISVPHLWQNGNGLDVDCNRGWYIQSAAQTLHEHPNVPESVWGTVIGSSTCEPDLELLKQNQPTEEVLAEEVKYRLHEMSGIGEGDVAEVRSAIAEGFPVIASFPIFRDSGWSSYTQKPSISLSSEDAPPLVDGSRCRCACGGQSGCHECPPDQSEHCVEGFHAVSLVGYDDATSQFLLLNSWSEAWKNGGTFPLDYDYAYNYMMGAIAVRTVHVCSNPSCDLPDECDACLDTSCETAYVACQAEPDCAQLLGCVRACSNTACVRQCKRDFPAAMALADPIVASQGCWNQHCEQSCGDLVHACSVFEDAEGQGCNECVDAQCATACSDCASDQDCWDLVVCVRSCMDDACVIDCMNAHPDGVDAAEAFIGSTGCVQAQCEQECAPPDQCWHQPGPADCNICLNDNCLDVCDKCGAECQAFVACYISCEGDQPCEEACWSSHPDGIAPVEELLHEHGCMAVECGQECGIETGSCAALTGDAACDACLSSHCISECESCLDDLACAEATSCSHVCPDSSCLLSCTDHYAPGSAEADAFLGPSGCLAVHCAGECGIDTSCYYQPVPQSCADCVEQSCTAECDACLTESGCGDFINCYNGCADEACRDDCFAQYPLGSSIVGDMLDLDGCVVTHCASACGEPYGTLSVTFASDFVYDRANQEPGYHATHPEGTMTTAAFSGSYGASTPVAPASASVEATACHGSEFSGYLLVEQRAMGGTPEGMQVVMTFDTDEISSGSLTVAAGVPSSRARIEVFEHVMEASHCLSAVGYGTVDVTVAENTTASEGGRLHFSGSMPLYYPTETPYGNLHSGFTLCPKQ